MCHNTLTPPISAWIDVEEDAILSSGSGMGMGKCWFSSREVPVPTSCIPRDISANKSRKEHTQMNNQRMKTVIFKHA